MNSRYCQMNTWGHTGVDIRGGVFASPIASSILLSRDYRNFSCPSLFR
ncbi:MAG: hypothetical protein IPK84_04995 [Candidatus Moraniibacteriota bacterium]|nr:MAG: hypothetical protein IPK84_04995 [Candidatus Moranbacteria bacterium]